MYRSAIFFSVSSILLFGTAFFLPAFQNGFTIFPAALVVLDSQLDGFADPFRWIIVLGILERVGDQRCQRTDILFIQLEHIRTLDRWRGDSGPGIPLSVLDGAAPARPLRRVEQEIDQRFLLDLEQCSRALTAFSSPEVISSAESPRSFTLKSILFKARNGPSICSMRQIKYKVTFNSATSSICFRS